MLPVHFPKGCFLSLCLSVYVPLITSKPGDFDRYKLRSKEDLIKEKKKLIQEKL